jgi:hypothetical protein
MRSVSLLAAAVIGVSALAAACGQQQAGPAASGPSGSTAPSAAPSTAPPAAAACGSATPTAPPNRTLTLSAGDNGRSFCIRPGIGVLVYLKGTPMLKWDALKSSSATMMPKANGHLALALGVTGGYFVAAHPGVAAITSTRNPCGPQVTPTGPTNSNPRKCGITQTFKVTVRVAG